MVWFQCDDCGENLRKPKLSNHFRICSANKLSCIDCGVTFGQQSVQGHTACITEAEKYGPKGEGKSFNGTQAKKKPDVDINVGLSSHPPWFCSLCNTNATSKQTLLIHADGKKHRVRARAFHASKQQPKETVTLAPNTSDLASNLPKSDSICNNGEEVPRGQDSSKSTSMHTEAQNGTVPSGKKRKVVDTDDESSMKNEVSKDSVDLSNGEMIQAKKAKLVEREGLLKKTKHLDSPDEEMTNLTVDTKEAKRKKIKWKKLITSVLSTNPDGVMKMKKLRKLILKSLQESGQTEDEDQLGERLVEKINSSSRFTLDSQLVSLVAKG